MSAYKHTPGKLVVERIVTTKKQALRDVAFRLVPEAVYHPSCKIVDAPTAPHPHFEFARVPCGDHAEADAQRIKALWNLFDSIADPVALLAEMTHAVDILHRIVTVGFEPEHAASATMLFERLNKARGGK